MQEPEDQDVLDARWKKKGGQIEHLSGEIQRLRYNVSTDLKSDDEKLALTALVVALMDKTAERVGNETSAENGHHGITGLKKRHVSIDGNKITLNYTGKSGVDQDKSFSDETIAKYLKQAIKNSPTAFVFATSDKFKIKADKINRYLDDFGISAKDVRGYSANKWIINKLSDIVPEETDVKRKRQFNKIVKSVAEKIGHGRATLKKHYLIPELEIAFIERGEVINISEAKKYVAGGEIESEPVVIENPTPIVSETEEIKSEPKKNVIDRLINLFTDNPYIKILTGRGID